MRFCEGVRPNQRAASEPVRSAAFFMSGITAMPLRVKPDSLTSDPHAMV